MAKHYVTINESGVIIRGFSTDFEQPTANDICICEDGGRHFALGGEINPPMMTDDGILLYKLVGGEVLARSAEEIEPEKIAVAQIPTLEERTAALENAMLELIMGGTV